MQKALGSCNIVRDNTPSIVLPAAAQPAQYGENPGGYAYEHSHDQKHKNKEYKDHPQKDYKDYPQQDYKEYPVHHEHKSDVCSCVGFPGQDGPPGRDGKDGEYGPPGELTSLSCTWTSLLWLSLLTEVKQRLGQICAGISCTCTCGVRTTSIAAKAAIGWSLRVL
jgi:hypothetical protein